jgi:Phage integrase family
MWIIGFFTAMRPSELALLQKDCLIQEGANWKIIWNRKKSKDQHEVPITRTIAKVVQEQQSYINNLWGQDWEYLFCHYQDISKTDPTQPKIKPVKKVISKNKSPLKVAINCLIKAENICDENGKLATFRSSLLRTTRLTQLFEQGHDLAIVSAWAGHKQLATTSLHYTKVSCELIAKEAGHVQKALFNADGIPLYYESMPKTFWENPRAHELDLPGDHINTPIYGYCGLNLDQNCDKFRACYTCSCFVATPEKIPLYIKTRDELRAKESRAAFNGHDVLVEQFGRQADQLDKIIAALDGENHE